jgi:peptidoglycan/xylan/chitin deacetylase (PgdA/CDA1 family)
MRKYTDLLADKTFVIFLFHGIYFGPKLWTARNTSGKHLEFRRFMALIDDLSVMGNPVSMDDIAKGNVPERAFAITFDDGFASAYHLGASYLDSKNIPATFYVTTGFLDNNGESWVDRVEQDIERMGVSEAMARALLSDLKAKPYHETLKFGHGGYNRPELDDKMTSAMICRLSQNKLFTIGGHTISHSVLEEDINYKYEIEGCLADLSMSVWGNINHFSYPEGKIGCDSPEVIACLKENGIVCCPTAQYGLNHEHADLFSLKRVMVT